MKSVGKVRRQSSASSDALIVECLAHLERLTPLLFFPLSSVITETGQRPGEHADEVHATLHPLHQTQRDQKAEGLGRESVSGRLPRPHHSYRPRGTTEINTLLKKGCKCQRKDVLMLKCTAGLTHVGRASQRQPLYFVPYMSISRLQHHMFQ